MLTSPRQERTSARPCWRCGLLGVFLALLSASPAAAALDPELKKPYNLQVVLHLAEHRALTSAFREELTRQLGDFLRLNFGELAQVEVVHTHPLLNEVLAKGLQQALDGWENLSDVKTHFVLIDFVGGRFRMRARQHDGMTGLSSPVVREDETGERELVARKAALLVDQDFGLSGTMIEVGGQSVKVALRGGGLGVSLQRWLQPGDVFAVSRITEEGDRRRASRLEWALLQTLDKPEQGVCRCRYVYRYGEDKLRDEPPVRGYRCLKLTTDTRPLRLRLLDEKTLTPCPGLQVHVSAHAFGEKPREFATGPDGLIVTPAPAYRHMAFVRVLSGARQVAQFPVALVDAQTVVCRLNIDAHAGKQGQLALRAERWLRRIYDNLSLSDARVGRLNALLAQSPEAALEPAQQGLKNLSAEIASLSEEWNALRAAAGDDSQVRIDLAEGGQRLEELKRRQVGLGHFKERLEEVIREAASPRMKALKAALERARLLEIQADFQEAIDLYKKILADDPGQTKVKAQLEKLEEAWKLRNPAHAEARHFLYEVWPKKMDTATLKMNLAKAREAFRVCHEVGDRLTPRKMLKADLTHAANLKQRLEVLRRTPFREDTGAESQLIGQLAEELGGLNTQVSAFVKDEKGAPR